MVFSSLVFLFIFFPVTLFFYFIMKNDKAKNIILVIASLIFYSWGEPVWVCLLIFSSVLDYSVSLGIEKYRGKKITKLFVALSVIINLGLLAAFKYSGFFVSTLNGIFRLSLHVPTFSLPIGISFYTFQTMSYSLDVYKGEVKAQKSFINFLMFVSLFPQLIAGPIVRYSDIDTQIDHRTITIDGFANGMTRFMAGLGKKVLLANQMGAVWEEIAAMSAPSVVTAWLGALAFTFQIYFDFSGYSDMAIGLGRLFGFRFLENFNYPYESRTVTEFWRRWHISLSTWFREYVYIPLGGNRKGLGRQLLNIAIVWFLTGLWHGASWNFVLWGVYYAVLLLLEKTFLLQWLDRVPAVVGHIYTCLCFIMGWVLFAITDFTQLGAYLGHMFSGTLFDGTAAYLLRSFWLVLVLAVIGCTSLPKRLWSRWEGGMAPAASDALRTAWMVLVLLVSVAFLVGDSYNPFLYFRF